MYKYFFWIFLFFTQYTYSQNKIFGKLLTKEKKPLGGATVILSYQNNDKTIAFTTSLQNGEFELVAPSGVYNLKIRHLGYKTHIRKIVLEEKVNDLGIITLIKNTLELEEVFIKAESKIITKGDTTIYKSQKFLNGTEINLEDVLLNLPGVDINQNGKITYKGKVVDRLLIDNENLYKNQHQLATENLPADMIKDVEIIKNYKDFETIGLNDKTGLTALNINIKEYFKNKFTGAFGVAAGVKNKYEVKPLLFNFRKIIKSSLISNFNNTGNSPLTLQDYIELTNETPIDSETNKSSVTFSKNENIPQFLLVKDKVKYRTTNFLTLSAIIKPSKKFKIDFYSILNQSTQKRVFSNENILTTNAAQVNILENSTNFEDSFFGITHLKTTYKKSENSVVILDFNLNTEFSKKNNGIENTKNAETTFFKESIKPKTIISKTNLSYKRKQNNTLFKTNFFLNSIFKESNLTIDANSPFLGLFFQDDIYRLSQSINQSDLLTGIDLIYSKDYILSGFKARFNTSYNLQKFNSINNQNNIGFNNLELKTFANRIGVEYNYKFNKILGSRIGTNYNLNLRYLNGEPSVLSFADFDATLKAEFTTNNVGKISYNYFQNTTSLENLFLKPIVKNYRNILSNQDVSMY